MGFDYFVFYTEASIICIMILLMILITDRAVKLLGTSDKLNNLIKIVRLTIVCDDSIRFYNASVPDPVKDMIRTVPSSDITDQIIESRPDIIIE